VLLGGIGAVFSLPLIWGDGGWQGLTTGLPFLVCAMVMALGGKSVKSESQSNHYTTARALHLVAGLIVSLLAIGVVRHVWSTPVTTADLLTVRTARDAFVNVAEKADAPSVPMGALTTTPEEAISIMRRTGLGVYGLGETLRTFHPPSDIAVTSRGLAMPDSFAWLIFPGLTSGPDTRVRAKRYTVMPDAICFGWINGSCCRRDNCGSAA